jgi:hypothetical protein
MCRLFGCGHRHQPSVQLGCLISAACPETLSQTDFYDAPDDCEHVKGTCRECMREYLHSVINRRETTSANHVPCPVPSCNRNLRRHILDELLTDEQIESISASTTLAVWMHLQNTDGFVGSIRVCPNQECLLPMINVDCGILSTHHGKKTASKYGDYIAQNNCINCGEELHKKPWSELLGWRGYIPGYPETEWRQSLVTGYELNALDTSKTWRRAVIKGVEVSKVPRVKIRFRGLDPDFDEWIYCSSPRLEEIW